MFKLIYQVMKVYDRYKGPAKVLYAEFRSRSEAVEQALKLDREGIALDGRINFIGEIVTRISWK
jgi:hypothetical protein